MKTVLLVMKNRIIVRHFGINLEIVCQNSDRYASGHRYVIPDYSQGKRIRHIRTTESEARDKAKEICEILATGRQEERGMLADDDLKFDVRRAREILQPTSLRLSRAAQ